MLDAISYRACLLSPALSLGSNIQAPVDQHSGDELNVREKTLSSFKGATRSSSEARRKKIKIEKNGLKLYQTSLLGRTWWWFEVV